jgi:3-oxoacyl-[acyl-carrier protein] reductase
MEERVAIVTGAGGGGMGRAIAIRLAKEGYRVVVADRNQAGCEETAAIITAKGLRGVAIPVDVSNSASVKSLYDEAAKAYGGAIDCLVHCAAIFEGTKLEELAEEAWDRLIDVNLKGTFLMVKAAAPYVKQSKAGRIICFASQAGRNGGIFSGPHYAASKGGVLAFVRNVAHTLAPFGVTVNAISPGVANTPMGALWPPEVLETTAKRTPLGRLAEPDDIAGAVAFLLSDDARFITGETMEVNGGYLMD